MSPSGRSCERRVQELLSRAIRGDPQALSSFFRFETPGLDRYIRNRCRQWNIDVELVADFCQDTILKAVAFIRKQQEARDEGRPWKAIRWGRSWLWTIADNRLRDWLRAQELREMRSLEALEMEVEDESSPDAGRIALTRDLMSCLDARERDIVEQAFMESKKLREIAESLGISLQRVQQILQAALEKMETFGKDSEPST